VKATKEYTELAKNQLDDGFMATPAVTGKALILRTRSAIYRIEE
jgi:outer membrane protein assembly factor BamB